MNQEQVLSLIRQGMMFIGGFLVIKGIVDEVMWQGLIGSVAALVSSVWSFFVHKEKKA